MANPSMHMKQSVKPGIPVPRKKENSNEPGLENKNWKKLSLTHDLTSKAKIGKQGLKGETLLTMNDKYTNKDQLLKQQTSKQESSRKPSVENRNWRRLSNTHEFTAKAKVSTQGLKGETLLTPNYRVINKDQLLKQVPSKNESSKKLGGVNENWRKLSNTHEFTSKTKLSSQGLKSETLLSTNHKNNKDQLLRESSSESRKQTLKEMTDNWKYSDEQKSYEETSSRSESLKLFAKKEWSVMKENIRFASVTKITLDEVKTKAWRKTYMEPKAFFFFLRFENGREKILNSACRKITLMDHVKKFLQTFGYSMEIGSKPADLDFCDLEGHFLNIDLMDKNQNLDEVITARSLYIPYMVQRDDDFGLLENARLCLSEDDKSFAKISEILEHKLQNDCEVRCEVFKRASVRKHARLIDSELDSRQIRKLTKLTFQK